MRCAHAACVAHPSTKTSPASVLAQTTTSSLKLCLAPATHPAGEAGAEMVVVPMALGLVHSISALRISIPPDLRPADARRAVLLQLQVRACVCMRGRSLMPPLLSGAHPWRSIKHVQPQDVVRKYPAAPLNPLWHMHAARRSHIHAIQPFTTTGRGAQVPRWPAPPGPHRGHGHRGRGAGRGSRTDRGAGGKAGQEPGCAADWIVIFNFV